ncbi:zinc transporter ZupT [Ornithinimicrobium tianjinense]|uniref:Zinc transporter ZupT n=1 Tax=Ornithinimicrobium tianjinense TaxID=1195761 RepID=A0A917BCA1_9MICO|nr:zinc transporter ZupT [Ornithinimicrobium tianjinense]
MTLALVVALLAGLSTVLGGWLGTRQELLRRQVLAAALAFAAGLMIAISVVEIAPQSAIALREVVGPTRSLLWVGAVMVVGWLLVVLIDLVIPHDVNPSEIEGDEGHLHRGHDHGLPFVPGVDDEDRGLLRSGMLLAAVVGLHNLPEGLATFMSTLQDPTAGITLAVAIAIHNVPEGVAVAAPIFAATASRARALTWATLSGLAEPVGAVVGYLLLRAILPEEWLILSLTLVAGMMLAVSFKELLPAARRYETHYSQSLVGFFLGAVVMVLSLVLLTL